MHIHEMMVDHICIKVANYGRREGGREGAAGPETLEDYFQKGALWVKKHH